MYRKKQVTPESTNRQLQSLSFPNTIMSMWPLLGLTKDFSCYMIGLACSLSITNHLVLGHAPVNFFLNWEYCLDYNEPVSLPTVIQPFRYLKKGQNEAPNDPTSNNLIFIKSLPPKWGKHLAKIKWLDDFTTIIWAVAKFRLSCSKQWQYKEANPIVTCTPKESISSPGFKQQMSRDASFN